jgi:hypothetical protein
MRSKLWKHNGVRREDGVVSIELALVLPLLLLLIFGMVQFGRAYNAKVELTSAVREGARVLALGTGDPEARTLEAAPGLDPDAITVDLSHTPPDPCPADGRAWVTASYDFDLNIPFWGSETIGIGAKGVMRCGG